MSSLAHSRRRRVPRAPRTSPSAIRLAFAPSSRCPHCGRDSKTVQGVCADCWGSKGGRLFLARNNGPGWPPALSPILVGALLAVLPIAILVLLWILD
jgi:hypothetical protein